ncbi:DNA polymerase III subunit beta, partial [bacterium]|nr:DNA polymerase III subunit beta [bacterium]
VATASDLQTTARISMAVDASGDGTIAVPAKIFLETLRNLPEQPITIQVDEETYSIEITSDNGRYKVSGANSVDFPRVPAVANAFSVQMEAGSINRALGNTLFATSNDELEIIVGSQIGLQQTGSTSAGFRSATTGASLNGAEQDGFSIQLIAPPRGKTSRTSHESVPQGMD